jgi:hypothetical protein
MIINIVVIITINNRLFDTHTHACQFMTSKPHGKQKKWYAMTNIGAINSRHTKNHGLP